MFWLYLTIFGIVLVAISFVLFVKDFEDFSCIFFIPGFGIVFVFSIVFAIQLIDKRDSTLFYYDKIAEKERIEIYGETISLDNDEALKEYADKIYKYNKEISDEQNKYKIYGNIFSFRDKIILELKPIEYDKSIPVKTVRVIE